jgi:hypothetical protein
MRPYLLICLLLISACSNKADDADAKSEFIELTPLPPDTDIQVCLTVTAYDGRPVTAFQGYLMCDVTLPHCPPWLIEEKFGCRVADGNDDCRLIDGVLNFWTWIRFWDKPWPESEFATLVIEALDGSNLRSETPFAVQPGEQCNGLREIVLFPK